MVAASLRSLSGVPVPWAAISTSSASSKPPTRTAWLIAAQVPSSRGWVMWKASELSATRLGVLPVLQDQDSSTVAHHHAVAILRERPAGLRRQRLDRLPAGH